MSFTVEKSFDYCNFRADYKNKKVTITYPHKSPKHEEFWIFSFLSIFIAGILNIPIAMIFTDSYDVIWVGVLAIPTYFVISNMKSVRFWIMKVGHDPIEYNQIYLSGIKKRKVTINNFGNYFTDYKAYGDYGRCLEIFEIKCVKLIKKRKKSLDNPFRKPDYNWVCNLVFSKVPKNGHMTIINQRGASDKIIGDGIMEVMQSD